MFHRRLAAWLGGALVLSTSGALASSDAGLAAAPQGEPVLGTPTLHSLGVHWIVAGDSNANAHVKLARRVAGGEWKEAGNLWRVERGGLKKNGSVRVPENAAFFAGSFLLLAPNTAYELKLSLVDPDGGNAETVLRARTIAEPVAPNDARIFHVVPGAGGGTGTAEDPFKGLRSAQMAARPGTIFLLHAGKYPPLHVHTNGEQGRPIIFRAAGDGEVLIEGEGDKTNVVVADGRHDVWFEGLTLRNGNKGIAGRGSSRLVVRGCRMSGVTYGIFATTDAGGQMRGWFIADNVIEGPSTWPRTKGIETARGIQITGEGHVVCYNRIRKFADAINTFESGRCAEIDFHNNDVSELTDDGIELDYSERNVRCFRNRLTNVFQGISTQPVHGGPVYIFRNTLYNVVGAPFKLHNGPSGVLLFHNTVVKAGAPFAISTSQPVRYSKSRNNLFVGSGGNYAFESSAKMVNCDFDFDGVSGGHWKLFLKWNGVRYASPAEAKAKGPAWKNAVVLDTATLFASKAAPPRDEKQVYDPVDLRLSEHGGAIDAGEVLPGINDDFTGQKPDLGAHEMGAPVPAYGPRSATPNATRSP